MSDTTDPLPTAGDCEAPAVATRIGPYEIVEALGHGSSGDVFRVRLKHQTFAVKLLRRSDTLLNELNVGLLKGNPHIVEVLEVGSSAAGSYIVMPYYPNGTLEGFLRRKQLTFSVACDVIAQIADGLAHLHANGVIHGDLKPSNVLVHRNNPFVVKISDFGLMRKSGRDLTVFGGSRRYAAPEQFDATKSSWSVDVFALGRISRELLETVPAPQGRWVFRKYSHALRCRAEMLATCMMAPRPVDRPSTDTIRFEIGWMQGLAALLPIVETITITLPFAVAFAVAMWLLREW